jgi:hypothetical protein
LAVGLNQSKLSHPSYPLPEVDSDHPLTGEVEEALEIEVGVSEVGVEEEA